MIRKVDHLHLLLQLARVIGHRAAEIKVLIIRVGGQQQLVGGLVGQVHDGLGVVAQDHTVLGELDALGPAHKELLAELFLQVGQLPRERGLGHVQRRRRS